MIDCSKPYFRTTQRSVISFTLRQL